MTEGEIVGWQAPGVGDGQGRLVCCSAWGCKESNMTLNSGIHVALKMLK